VSALLNRASRWIGGNAIELLENGEGYYPRVFEAIEQARREVLIETFILFDDKVGQALRTALIAAARRGVSVDLTIDGWGSPDLSDEFIHGMTQAGVRLHVFDHQPKLFGYLRLNLFRRLHRKLVVVDGRIAFIGGINFSADHLGDFGPEAKQDYSVRIEGPLAAHIRRFARSVLRQPHGVPADEAAARPPRSAAVNAARAGWRRWRERHAAVDEAPGAGGAQALFVTRDNHQHRNDIERHYRIAIRSARRQIIIANAYFFPGYRLLREMRRAARRGVDVRLILQGKPDMAIVPIAAGLLYQYLVGAGVTVYEYCRRPLHGKVALVDEEWATVGSSNLDPLSLSLNLEANVVIRDRGFNQTLRESLEVLMQQHCKRVDPQTIPKHSTWRGWISVVVFHVLRHFPAWAERLPRHAPRLTSLTPPPDAANSQ
jgi:cardiolipin synthase